ncbi:MAG: hypothetical protein AAF600_06730 [Bacteroidota bacterium]
MDQGLNQISSKQKGIISEHRIAEIVTLGSTGALTCYTPNSDDDGIDLIVNPKGQIKPLFIQIKGRFKLQTTGQFIQNVGINTFVAHPSFYLVFAYYNLELVDVQHLWLIPSLEFADIAYEKPAGETYKSFYRFSANPLSTKDRWSRYSIPKKELGHKLLEIIETL